MAASTNLTTLAAVEQYLGITGSDATEDALLTALIARASEAIENYCRRKFAVAGAYTEYYDGRGDTRLVLKQRPVVSVTSVHDDLDRDFAADSLIDADDYVLRADEGIIEWLSASSVFSKSTAKFQDGQLNVKVVYVAGYAAIPTDVALACIMLTAKLYHRGDQGADGIKSESHGGAYSVTYADGLIASDPIFRELLAHYRDAAL